MRWRKEQKCVGRQPWRGDGEVMGVKQQSLELRANYCNCNLDSKHRDAAVTGTRRQP